MKHRNLKIAAILIGLVMAFGIFAAPVQAQVTYSLSLQTTDMSGAAKTEFIRGEKFKLYIMANDLQGVAGCAFTLNYNSSILTAPVTDAEGVAATGITSLFPFTFVKTGHPDTGAVTMRENSGTPGKILFSGASIDTSTGGAKHASSAPGSLAPLFVVEFTVKADAPFATGYAFSLVQTTLHNPAAGYGTEAGTEQVPVPILVGAVPQSDATNWSNLTGGAFPVLLSTLGTTTGTFDVIDVPTYTIGGTISYTGKQTGTLKVGAFSDAGLTTPVGIGFNATWTGTSMAYEVSGLLGSASYYIRAFIDSNTTNSTPTTTEAQGNYGSAIAIVASNVTGKNFALTESQTGGLPSYWVDQYASFNNNQGIGSASADADHDGYSNIVEYQNGTNPTVADPPNGTGYDPALDTRPYTISGTVSYNGTQTGTLNVAAFAATDTTYSTPIGTGYQVAWSGTSKTYTISVPNGNYKVGAYIESTGNGALDTSEAQGRVGPFPVSGANLTGRNITLLDTTAKVQIVTAPTEVKAKAGGAVKFDVNYRTSNSDNTLSGIGIRIHYTDSKLTWVGFTNVFGTPTADPSLITPEDDTSDLDNDPTTDKFVVLAWFDFAGNWPNVTLPIRLLTANFTAKSGLAVGETAMIRFTSSSLASGYIFAGEPVTFTAIAINLDVDGNNIADALTDGLLIIRYLFDFRGNALINGAVGEGASRTTAADIEAYIAQAKGDILDIDGNGVSDALTDGLLTIRYLFDFRGNALISGAVGENPTRSTATDIGNYIEQVKP